MRARMTRILQVSRGCTAVDWNLIGMKRAFMFECRVNVCEDFRAQTCATLSTRGERDKAFSISPLPEGTIKSEGSHLSLKFMRSVR